MPQQQASSRRKTDRRLGVPRSFRLFGHRVRVRVVRGDKWPHPKDTVGMWDPDQKLIELWADQCDSALGQVFCHELVHAMLDEINEHKLSRNERFVDSLASVLHQALTSFSNR